MSRPASDACGASSTRGWIWRSTHRKKRTTGRPLRSGWRPAAMSLSALAIAPVVALGVAGSFGAPGVSLAVAADTPFTINGKTDSTGPIREAAGHGRGMGQLGAFGYAKEGWSAERIVGHYYAGTTLGSLPETMIAVRLQAEDDKPMGVISDAGLEVAGRHADAGQAVHLTPMPGGTANVVITQGCDGNVVWQGVAESPWVDPVDLGPSRPANEHMKLCSGGTYRGAMGVALEGAATRVVNRLDIEDYLLGVVPLEMSPGWADQGGAEALRAQAIAARSYAATDKRYDYAETCDTQSCQMYGGAEKEDNRTSDAVKSTHGIVLMKDGVVFKSEYSANSSADTDGGTPWTKTVSAGQIGTAFDVGELQSVTVTARDETGHVQNVHIVGTTGEANVTGTEFKDKLGLESDRFDVGGALPQAPASPDQKPGFLPPETKASNPSSAIEDKYRELGGMNSNLGSPIGPEIPLPDGLGSFRMFAGGLIIANPDVGAMAVDLKQFADLLPGMSDS